MAAGPEWPGKGGRGDGTDAQNRVGAFEAEVGLLVAGVFTDAGRTSDAVGVAGLRVEHARLLWHRGAPEDAALVIGRATGG